MLGFNCRARIGMKRVFGSLGVAGLIAVIVWLVVAKTGLIELGQGNALQDKMPAGNQVILPEPKKQSETSIEEALFERRSVREYRGEALNLEEISQLLWAAQGITAPERGGRTAPSAGALYPLELYLVAKEAQGLAAGVYHYLPEGHKLERRLEGDLNLELARAALGQTAVEEAPVTLVFTAVFERTTQKYGQRGRNYVYLEAGHAAQNVYLQVQSLDLGTVVIGAFDDEAVKKCLALSQEEIPLYIMPIGRP